MKIEILCNPIKNKTILEGNKYLRILKNSFLCETDSNRKEQLKRDINEINDILLSLRASLLETESYINVVNQLLLDLIISAKEHGLNAIPISMVENVLKTQGFNIDKKSLYDLISNIPNVEEVRPDKDVIKFTDSFITRVVSDEKAQRERNRITKTAIKVAKNKLRGI